MASDPLAFYKLHILFQPPAATQVHKHIHRDVPGKGGGGVGVTKA